MRHANTKAQRPRDSRKSQRRRGPPAYAWRVHHSLRRRLFRAFGVAIVLSGGLGFGVYHLLDPGRFAALFALASAALVLWMAAGGIAWSVTRPLIELVSVAQDIGAGKLERRMRLRPLGKHHGRGGREIVVLAEAVNTMAERIEGQIAGQRELLASVSHELRTPLGHLRVLVDTAREALGEHESGDHAHEPGKERLFDELEREVLELDGLVDQLLAHSRLEFERIEQRRLDPVALAVRALERVGEDASKIEVETELDQVEGDPTLLGRALANLLINGRAHGRGVLALRVYDEGDTLCFCVDDRGPGFATDELDTVFGSFVQGRGHEGGSLGLGLSLVQRIAQAHGGQAWAQNREGEGASVGFSIPSQRSGSMRP